ncbi:hypothetical protein K6U06_05845 [Acidiferrimicrobium sp. IK]|uniref:hypothetical protein n=1 Tax=Acidiferrimicrobium sp. IK TaxID=2871700 RepID=UPI0021CB94AA|nr:hypothetical protein [Acidiferrimicrobium sp. IK]MCU4183875.1 hypothetical protein [Acidiferrimicrobium sp. IK]
MCRLDDPEAWRATGVTVEQAWDDDTAVWEHIQADRSPLHEKAVEIIRTDNPDEYRAMRRWVSRGERPQPAVTSPSAPLVHRTTVGWTANVGRPARPAGGVTLDVGHPPEGTWLAGHADTAAAVASKLEAVYGPEKAATLLERAGGDRFYAVWLEIADHWLENVPPENRPARFPWHAAYEQGWRPHEAVSTARELGHSPEALEDFGLIDNAAEWRPEIG